jgi:hypothetical protein
MNLAEALAAVAEGKRVRSPAISQGWVVKAVNSGWSTKLRVFNEATGSSFAFDVDKPDYQRDDWQIVEGWA